MAYESIKKALGGRQKFETMKEAKFIGIPSEDEASEPLTGTMSTATRCREYTSRRTIALTVGLSVVILLLLADLVCKVAQEQRDLKRYQFTPCGETAAEARAAGCHYEAMHRSWIPSACYFSEPSEEYDPYIDRDWYADANLTIPANMDLLRSGDLKMAYTQYFHDEHCLYGWRKLAIAVEKKLDMIDSKSYNIHHTSHCAMNIADMLRKSYDPKWDWYFDDQYTESPLMFQTCIPLKWK